MLIADPKTFAKVRTGKVKPIFPRLEVSAAFSRRCRRAEDALVLSLDRETLLRQLFMKKLRERGVIAGCA